MDQLRAMRVFVRVIDVGSFAKASEALDIAPAVATRLVAELEQHLGARLINRTTRRLALTEVGESYLQRVRSILLDIDDAEALASLATAEPQGRLSVLAPAGFAVHQLARKLGLFTSRYPRMTIDLTISPSVEVPDENHDITIVVQRDRPIDGAFVARRIASTQVVLYASPQYLGRRGSPAVPGDLLKHDLLIPTPAGGGREVRLEQMTGEGGTISIEFERPSLLTTAHSDTLYAAARSGLGIAALPSMIADESVRNSELEVVLPDWRLSTLTLFAAMPSRKHLPKRTQVFVQFLAETFGSESPDRWLGSASKLP